MRRTTPLLLGTALALAVAAPATAAEVRIAASEADAGAPTWLPNQVSIAPGDTVVWSFAGMAQAHNVEAGSPNWTHQSPLGIALPDDKFQFTASGTYHFVCQVHPTTMVGDVVVGDAPPPPPPPLSEQPFPNDSTPPSPLETDGPDRAKPSLRSVRVARTGNGAKVRFKVSESARVTVRFKRGGKTVRSASVNAAGGSATTLRARRLAGGRYRIEVRAVDAAGNRSSLRTARLTVR